MILFWIWGEFEVHLETEFKSYIMKLWSLVLDPNIILQYSAVAGRYYVKIFSCQIIMQLVYVSWNKVSVWFIMLGWMLVMLMDWIGRMQGCFCIYWIWMVHKLGMKVWLYALSWSAWKYFIVVFLMWCLGLGNVGFE